MLAVLLPGVLIIVRLLVGLPFLHVFQAGGSGFLQALLLILSGFWSAIAPKLGALVGLIFLDFVLGVAAAIRKKQFDWRQLGDFYYTMVFPLLLGWLALSFASQWVGSQHIGPELGWLFDQGFPNVTWLVSVSVIGASVLRNGKFLYGDVFGPKAAPVTDRLLDD